MKEQTTRIPVLCYHGMIANTPNYAGNDHRALEADLELLEQLGYTLISSRELIQHITQKIPLIHSKPVCLTFDDAPPHDMYSYHDPRVGHVKSIRRILRESAIFRRHPRPATSFAIASPAARQELAITCMNGERRWGSEWWASAIDEGTFEIGNHSLDHMHDTLEKTAHSKGAKGNFTSVDNYADADTQIRQAQEIIDQLTNSKSAQVFAYPYGDYNDYLVHEYFPLNTNEHKQIGAFATGGGFATQNSNPWCIPRLVCGSHWKSSDELNSLLTK